MAIDSNPSCIPSQILRTHQTKKKNVNKAQYLKGSFSYKPLMLEVQDLTRWYQYNNLLLNISKTNGLIVDFGKDQEAQEEHLPSSH